LTGRLLLEREPYPVNVQAVIDACAATGTWMELNCNPHRFDLDWRLWPYAKSRGVKCVINPDAHRNEHAGFLRLGAGIARKRAGWTGAGGRGQPGTGTAQSKSRGGKCHGFAC
jgi:DNA polymerase (family 10)